MSVINLLNKYFCLFRYFIDQFSMTLFQEFQICGALGLLYNNNFAKRLYFYQPKALKV